MIDVNPNFAVSPDKPPFTQAGPGIVSLFTTVLAKASPFRDGHRVSPGVSGEDALPGLSHDRIELHLELVADETIEEQELHAAWTNPLPGP